MLELARRGHHWVGCPVCICHNLLYLAENVRAKVDFEKREILVQVVLILAKGELIALLKPTVVIWLLLHSVIRQVDQFVCQVIVDKWSWWGTQISIVVCVAFQLAINECEHAKAANVELALIVKRRPLDVFLDNESLLTVIVACLEDALDLAQSRADAYTVAAVGVFSRLDDPYVTWCNNFLFHYFIDFLVTF